MWSSINLEKIFHAHLLHFTTEKIVKFIKKGSIVLHIVDLLDFEASLVPELFLGCRQKELPSIFLINKIDLLPKQANLNRIKLWARQMAKHMKIQQPAHQKSVTPRIHLKSILRLLHRILLTQCNTLRSIYAKKIPKFWIFWLHFCWD